MDDLFRTLTLSNVSGDVMGSAMDILASGWSNSSNWSNSQRDKEEQDIVPFLEPYGNATSNIGRVKAACGPAPRSPSGSNQTAVMITDGSAMTGSSSFGQGSSRHTHEAACCSSTATDLPLTKERVTLAQAQLDVGGAVASGRDDAASEFSRSTSSGWSHSEPCEGAAGSNTLQISELIGRGAFGSVYRGLWKGKSAAIKVVEHDDGLLGEGDELDIFTTDLVARSQLDTAGSSMNCSTAIMMEAALSSAVMHPNIVQTYDYETRSSSTSGGQETYVVMEWCEKGSLQSAVSDGMFHVHDSAWGHDAIMPMICATLLDIATGMAYLHKMHILHCDLKLRNVLLKAAQDDWRGFLAKVSDFGLSKLLPESHLQVKDKSATDDVAGTVTHMSPELLSGGSMSAAADVYAFGILMYELWTGKSAFPGLSKVQVMVGVVDSGLRPAFPHNCPTWYSTLAATCWAQSAAVRPSFAVICSLLVDGVNDGGDAASFDDVEYE